MNAMICMHSLPESHWTAVHGLGRLRRSAFLLLCLVVTLPAGFTSAQVDATARFALEKNTFVVGEPVFVVFSIRNSGRKILAFAYRSPSRVLTPELEQEPAFAVTGRTGRRAFDPAPQPCGGAGGTVVYGSVTLPPGQTHTERWLLNQWARLDRPGNYMLRARRRLPLHAFNPSTQKMSDKPSGYALALNDLTFEMQAAIPGQVEAVLEQYVRQEEEQYSADALLVLSTLPQPFLLDKFRKWVTTPRPPGYAARDRKALLEGLARLGSPAAWDVIAEVARGDTAPILPGGQAGDALRSHAILLLGEKREARFVPVLLEILTGASESVRGETLRALGFFRHPQANEVLFENLRSPRASDRVNAVLGLRNLESREAIPALIGVLNDPDAQVRQVANFALRGLTGEKFRLSLRATPQESLRLAELWRAWWREKGSTFTPPRQATCRDW